MERQGRRLAQRWTRDPAAIDDILQEALIRMWRYRDQLGDPGQRTAWMRTIVHREASRHRARQRREVLEGCVTLPADEDPEVLSIPARLDMRRALAGLESAERVLIRLRYEHDLTQPAIARLLEIPEGTVKVRLHRAREKLRRAYETGGS